MPSLESISPVPDPEDHLRAVGLEKGEDGVWRSPGGDVYDPTKMSHSDVPAAAGDTEPAQTFNETKFAAPTNGEIIDANNTDTFIKEEVPKQGATFN